MVCFLKNILDEKEIVLFDGREEWRAFCENALTKESFWAFPKLFEQVQKCLGGAEMDKAKGTKIINKYY